VYLNVDDDGPSVACDACNAELYDGKRYYRHSCACGERTMMSLQAATRSVACEKCSPVAPTSPLVEAFAAGEDDLFARLLDDRTERISGLGRSPDRIPWEWLVAGAVIAIVAIAIYQSAH